jgi:Zn-dependent protease with chaperone function
VIAAAALLGWAVLLGVAVPAVLSRAAWPQRAPNLGLFVWQAASASFLAALVLGGLALAVPVTVLSGGLADLVANCVMAVRAAYRTPTGASAAGAGIVLAATVIGRVTWCLVSALAAAAVRRRKHARGLALVAYHDATLDALIVDHGTAQAYCLPGRRPAIVLTSGALAALDDARLSAVLAHERAHVRARHHLLVTAAAGLTRAFPMVRLLREAAVAVPQLVEMAADDAAGSRTGRSRVAAALVTLAVAAPPAAVLAAGGPGALTRVQRLLRPATPLDRAGTAAVVAVALVFLAAPALAAVAPAWAAGPMPDCHMVMTR